MKKHFKKLLLMALMAVMAVGLIACGTDTVSYTHLDVYKRQAV